MLCATPAITSTGNVEGVKPTSRDRYRLIFVPIGGKPHQEPGGQHHWCGRERLAG